MKIPGQTRSSAIRSGYDIVIRGVQYEVIHISSKKVVSRSEISAREALNIALGTRRTRSVIDPAPRPPNVLAEAVREELRIKETGSMCPDTFNRICSANGIKPKRWQHLNGGMKVMALINTLKGIVNGSKGRDPKTVVIGKSVIRP